MDEEDAKTDTEIQNEKKYIYAEPGNDKREFSPGNRKAFENDKSGEAENKRGEEYACPVKYYRYFVFFREWLEVVFFAHGKVYHRRLFLRRWDIQPREIY